MNGNSVDRDVLWLFTTEGPFLDQVQDWLVNAGELELKTSLYKLEQDVGVRLKVHMMDPSSASRPASSDLKGMEAFLRDADPANLHETTKLMKAYETVTYKRISSVLRQVEEVLRSKASELLDEFVKFNAAYVEAIPKTHDIQYPAHDASLKPLFN